MKNKRLLIFKLGVISCIGLLFFSGVSPASLDPDVKIFYAKYAEPCGYSVLKIAAKPNEEFKYVWLSGKNNPIKQLKYHMLLGGKWKIKGRFTGKAIKKELCGKGLKEFEIISYEPWGSIARCTYVQALYDKLHFYTAAYSKTHYVPEDFVGNADPKKVDCGSCQRDKQPGLYKVTGCDGIVYYCKLLD
ncbi:hypothetical protein BKI52_22955 [marine bacterium AO1-C]|nr:hypothetical protein BKI52_22955 [marine bacterium AO1-C]